MSSISLDDLKRLDQKARKRFAFEDDETGFSYSGSFDELGLHLLKPHYFDSWCTPKNTFAFAQTGGDGIHFSFLPLEGKHLEDRPVVITQPSDMGSSTVIGENLYDFLCAGCRCGFDLLSGVTSEEFWDPSSLHSISTRLDDILRVEASYEGAPEWLVRLADAQGQLLDFLTQELSLAFWEAPRRHYEELQSRFGHLIEIPPEETC